MRAESLRAAVLTFALGIAIGVAPSVSAGCAMQSSSVQTAPQRRAAVVKAAEAIETIGLIAEQAQRLEIQFYAQGAISDAAHQRIQIGFRDSARAVQAAIKATRTAVAIDAQAKSDVAKAFDAIDALLKEVNASIPDDPDHPARAVIAALNAARLILSGAEALLV